MNIKIRARSVMKLTTGSGSLDYEYGAGCPVEEPMRDLIHALVQRDGTAKASAIIAEHLKRYEPDYPGLQK